MLVEMRNVSKTMSASELQAVRTHEPGLNNRDRPLNSWCRNTAWYGGRPHHSGAKTAAQT